MIPIGALCPDIDLPTQFGTRWRARDARGKRNILILMYPEDWTPICSSELPEVNRMATDFARAGTEVVSMNCDSASSHRRWSETLGGITFPMLCDCWPKGAACRALGAFHEDKGVADRATVIVGKDGNIKYAQSVGLEGRRDFLDLLHQCQRVNGQAPSDPITHEAPAGCATSQYARAIQAESAAKRIKAAELPIQAADAVLFVSDMCSHCAYVKQHIAGRKGKISLVMKEVSANPDNYAEMIAVNPGGLVPTLLLKGGNVVIGRDQVLAKLLELLPDRK